MVEPPAKKPSLRHEGGVAKVLEDVKTEMLAKMTEKLQARAEQGRSNLSEDEISTIARIAAQLTRELCANAVGEAFQIGVNANARAEDFDKDTARRGG